MAASHSSGRREDAPLAWFPPLPSSTYKPYATSLLRVRLNGLSEKQRKENTNGDGPAAASLGTLLQSAWAVTVATYTGNDEALINVALSGRDVAVQDIANMGGSTLTTVPVRVKIDKEQPVADLLTTVSRQAKEIAPFADAGLYTIRNAVPRLGPNLDAGHLFIIRPALADSDSPGLETIGLEQGNDAAIADSTTESRDAGSYALAVDCRADAESVHVELHYDCRVLSARRAGALLSLFRHVVGQLEDAHTSNATLGDLDLLKPADVEAVRRWNAPVLTANPNRSCIHNLVQAMMERQPHAPAVASWDGDLSYVELGRASGRLAHYLVSIGVGPEVPVGVCMDKSRWATVSMLAILQAGGTVVALGTQHPLSRIEKVVADADVRITLADAAQAKRLHDVQRGTVRGDSTSAVVVIVVDQAFVEQLPAAQSPPATGVAAADAAWIVYTSGSTGTPKGVVLEHQALCTGMAAHGTQFGIGPRTRALSYAAHTFSVAVEDFTTLLLGGCVCIPSEAQRTDAAELARAIRAMRVNFVNLTTTTAALLDPYALPGIDTVVLGGEAVTPAVVDLWAPHATVINAYGQSECSVESVVNSRIEYGRDAANIGRPLAGSAAWVADPADYNRLVPVGAPGELLIQGPLLARGYLNDPAKTAAGFVSSPAFLTRIGFDLPGRSSRMYRTGDLVHQLDDGSLVYLGRCDAQIKIRGQRVEPGEIESQIVRVGHRYVVRAFVDLVRPRDAPHAADPVLTAAVEIIELQGAEVDSGDAVDCVRREDLVLPGVRAPTQGLAAAAQSIRAALIQELPAYMVPSYFVPLAGRLPVNASGKLDRRAARAILEALSHDQLGVFSSTRVARDPNRILTRTEERLRAVYAQVLGRSADSIGPEEFFTELGGDSVAAIHVVGASRRQGMVFSVVDVLQKQSISALAAVVGKRDGPDGEDHRLQRGLSRTSSAVTDHQQWILNYHIARPDVGMTWVALDSPGPLADGERMAEACKKLFATVEVLHTGFTREEDGRWKRVVLSGFQPEVPIHICTAATGSVEQWTEDFIRREGPTAIEPGRPLADVAICSTAEKHRILFRMSHAIYDGMCIHRFWTTLDELYRTGQASERASFSQYMAHTEKRQTPEASKYWAELLAAAAMPLIGDPPTAARLPDTEKYAWRAGGATCANVIKAAWALVLARYVRRDDVVFADVVSGRAGIDDPSVADALGCCSTLVPVRVRLDPSSTYGDLVAGVRRQQLAGVPFETFGYGRIARECTTGWPAGTPASSWVNHVPAPIDGSMQVAIGGAEYVVSQPRQEEQKWTFSEARIEWTQLGADALRFRLVYAVDKVSEQAARGLYDGLVSVVRQILSAPQTLIGSRLVQES
ncbi:uncharacterized protein B0H64DRAFT_455707 [Chaetomium fimeti]|uniref:Carrier domain-containing protein n=1 Tax=Chaetomium fimeti TaxID=1854472 RepID=A0AAE0LW04_9PEZI|nr:hypothetical protein B0H64DRAFT_455707 [Chaetomium fimeti]